jgi:hypothetical protein
MPNILFIRPDVSAACYGSDFSDTRQSSSCNQLEKERGMHTVSTLAARTAAADTSHTRNESTGYFPI